MKSGSPFQILVPSWVVNFVGMTAGILITGFVIIGSKYWGSDLRRQIFETQDNVQASSLSAGYQDVAANFASNSFLGQLPLLLTWAFVGFIVYFFAMGIARSLGKVVTMREEMNFVHASREDTMRRVWLGLAIRAVTTFGWFIFISITISVIVPYALAAANAAASGWSVTNAGYALLAVLVIYAAVYGHAIFLRLLLLRTRVFTS